MTQTPDLWALGTLGETDTLLGRGSLKSQGGTVHWVRTGLPSVSLGLGAQDPEGRGPVGGGVGSRTSGGPPREQDLVGSDPTLEVGPVSRSVVGVVSPYCRS